MAKNILQQLYYKDLENVYSRFSGIILDNVIGEIPDLQLYFENIANVIDKNTPVLISYRNSIYEPILDFASYIGLRKKADMQNWLDENDIRNLLKLSGFQVLESQNRFFGLTKIIIARLFKKPPARSNKFGVSIVIPAKNEEGNISKIIPSIPKFGKFQEFIFIEGNSKDKTWEKIKLEEKKRKNVIALKQNGHGKADAAWQGLKKATGEILMIYDADRTVPATDLPKFYKALVSGAGQFANGNRLLYPMEKGAMQTLNKIGNQIFSFLFTWILDQHFTDTLCGTKVFWNHDFKKFRRSKTDPFGDFDLIFGAIRLRLKVVEVPVRYRDRVYGSTNINRFYHGLLLIKMTVLAFIEFKL